MTRRIAAAVRAADPAGPLLLLAGRVVQLGNGLLVSVVVLHRFGLETVGTFALGIAALAVLAQLCPAGMPALLPRLDERHPRVAATGLTVLLAQAPLVLLLLGAYARWQGRTPAEAWLLATVGSGGFAIACTNVGLMLCIMRRRFVPAAAAPLCETVGLVVGAALAETPLQLAAVQLAGRACGVVVVWGGMRLERVSLAYVRDVARQSARYFALDVLSTGPEDVAPLIVAAFVSREELGLYRLCQQLLAAADSAGWTFVQSRYPTLVRGGRAALDRVARDVLWVSVVASVACVVGSTVLAAFAFRTPQVVPFMAVLSAVLPWRFRAYLYGQAFRAAGRVRAAAWLGVVRAAVHPTVFWLAVRAAGLWGAIVATAALSVAFGSLYARRFRALPAAEDPAGLPTAASPVRSRARA